MLELKNVSKFYSANGITNIGLQNINLKLNKGEIVAVTGESGSGKSTLLNVISKIDSFDEGEIYYKGNETSYFNISDMDDFRKNKVGFIFQNYNILDSYTVLENVELPLLLKGMPKAEASLKARELIEKVGLTHRLSSRGSKLSGGEKQRCVIARALASDCEILACDEPTGNLDSKTAEAIIKLIVELAKDKLVLIVTHNYPEVEGIVTRQIKMADGHIIEDIKYKEVGEEANEEFINLDYQPLDKKIIGHIAKLNAKNTPRKTILISIIMFVISLVFCFNLCSLSVVNNGLFGINEQKYANGQTSTVYVFNSDKSIVNMDLLKDYETIINPFSMEKIVSLSSNNDDNTTNFIYAYYAPNPKYSLLVGREPVNDNEFIYLLPENSFMYSSDQEKYLDKKYTIDELSYNSDFVCVGVGRYKMETATGVLSFGSSDSIITGCPRLMNLINMLNSNLSVKIKNEFYTSTLGAKFDPNHTGKLTLRLPIDYENDPDVSFKITSYDMYEISDYNVVYEDIGYSELVYGIDSNFDNNPYFVYINAGKQAKKIGKQLEKQGLSTYYNGKKEKDNASIASTMLGVTRTVSKVLTFFSVLSDIFNIFIVFLITSFILSRVYNTRVKDFEILRILGVTKKDMARVVKMEVICIGLIISVIGFIINQIIFVAVPFLRISYHFSIILSIVYFVVMFLFSYALAAKFNKKIYKFTASKSMRGDDDND